MLVYRLQTHDGRGIYSVGSIGFEANKAAILRDAGQAPADFIHPGPDNDEGLKKWWDGPWKNWCKKKQDWHYTGRQEYRCGFSSYREMLNWFPIEGFRMIDEYNEELQTREVYQNQIWIYVYSVHARKVKHGQFQVMFKPDEDTLSHVMPLKDFIKLVDTSTNSVMM